MLEQLTNRNVFVKIFNCGVNVKTKDCAGSRPFQHKLQHHYFHGKVSQPVPQLTMSRLRTALIKSEWSDFLRFIVILKKKLSFTVLTMFSSLNLEHHTRRTVGGDVYVLQAATLHRHSKNTTCVVCQNCCTKFGLEEKTGQTGNVIRKRYWKLLE